MRAQLDHGVPLGTSREPVETHLSPERQSFPSPVPPSEVADAESAVGVIVVRLARPKELVDGACERLRGFALCEGIRKHQHRSQGGQELVHFLRPPESSHSKITAVLSERRQARANLLLCSANGDVFPAPGAEPQDNPGPDKR